MHFLSGDNLTVSILDPGADVTKLGSRYCTGGYIWQVTDTRLGELLSGPCYPGETNTFDGQGLPDMFFTPLLPENTPVGGEVACIGVGRVRRTSPREPFYVQYNPEVIEFAAWEIAPTAENGLRFTTRQSFRGWAYQLERVVTLRGRALTSETAIHNTGADLLPVRWFSHPFFPHTPDDVLCRFSIPVSLPENPGFFLNPQGFITRKPAHDWQQGWYQSLDLHPTGEPSLTVTQKHPKIGQVTARTDFLPGLLPIWANASTFSFEPYFIQDLASGESAAWSIEYVF
jgi:hypothetical protein